MRFSSTLPQEVCRKIDVEASVSTLWSYALSVVLLDFGHVHCSARQCRFVLEFVVLCIVFF